MLKFTLHKKDGYARRGTLELNHGKIETPVFMPVGTYGSVKAMNPQNLHDIKAQIILGNTYHLWLRPGLEVIEQFGGLHDFIGWNKPILTDSGGFQVFSLSDMRKLTEEGCTFQSPINGDRLFLSPEISMKIQTVLNSDIVMQLDECTPGEATHEQAQKSLQMSLRWAERSKKAFEDLKNPNALFGIVQGAMYEDLREESLRGLEQFDFPGLAIGGLSVGEPKPEMYRMLRTVGPMLPEHKPHYLMGVGTPEDLVLRRGARRGHVRLRHAHPQCAQRLAVHPFRRFENQKRQTQARQTPDRRKLHLLRLPKLQPRLPAPSAPRRRNLGRTAQHHPQPAFLPSHHGRNARSHRARKICRLAGTIP